MIDNLFDLAKLYGIQFTDEQTAVILEWWNDPTVERFFDNWNNEKKLTLFVEITTRKRFDLLDPEEVPSDIAYIRNKFTVPSHIAEKLNQKITSKEAIKFLEDLMKVLSFSLLQTLQSTKGDFFRK